MIEGPAVVTDLPGSEPHAEASTKRLNKMSTSASHFPRQIRKRGADGPLVSPPCGEPLYAASVVRVKLSW